MARRRGTDRERDEGLTRSTRDHETIRRWAEERNGRPAVVRGTGGGGDPGIIRIDFPGYSGDESLEEVSWEEWFDKFDDNDLVFLYQDLTREGERSNFNKLISRETAEERTDS